MARYWIVSTTFSVPCAYGQQHLESMRFTPGVSLSYDIPIAELLAMRQHGAVFLLADPLSDEEVIPAGFKRCACGQGYVLRTWRHTQDNILPITAVEQQRQA